MRSADATGCRLTCYRIVNDVIQKNRLTGRKVWDSGLILREDKVVCDVNHYRHEPD